MGAFISSAPSGRNCSGATRGDVAPPSERRATLASSPPGLPQLGEVPRHSQRSRPVLLRGGEVLTLDSCNREGALDVVLAEGRVQAVGKRLRAPRGAHIVDCRGTLILPGLIQTHVHLCQALFRNAADGLPLLGWLQQRIWPFEAAHTPRSLRASADLGLAELLLSGTTAILDMGTVHHTDALFEAAAAAGVRYTGGKAMMDAGEGVPAGLRETIDDSIGESLSLARRHHQAENGRLRYAFCPRFALSCSRELLHEVAELSAREGLLVHTHASENVDELAAVKKATGKDNVSYFEDLGLCGDRLVLAHCVHLSPAEIELLARTRSNVVHCPGSNLKLASGIARLPELLRAGVNVGLGADGAPCNNTLDVFHELRLAATLHLPAFGAAALAPRDVLDLATRSGAKVLGLEHEIGQLAEGFAADVTVLDLSGVHFSPRGDDLAGAVVYAASGADVRDVFVEGKQLVERRTLKTLNVERVRATASVEAKKLFARLSRRNGS